VLPRVGSGRVCEVPDLVAELWRQTEEAIFVRSGGLRLALTLRRRRRRRRSQDRGHLIRGIDITRQLGDHRTHQRCVEVGGIKSESGLSGFC
jgi:hypothetical protein